jgi:hypothetical protein
MFSHEDSTVEETILISQVTLATTATPIPATPLVGRNALVIKNTGDITVNLCNEDGTGAYPLEPGDVFKFNTKDEVPLFYAKAASETPVTIMEWR